MKAAATLSINNGTPHENRLQRKLKTEKEREREKNIVLKHE
jgi:hypothetical protein